MSAFDFIQELLCLITKVLKLALEKKNWKFIASDV